MATKEEHAALAARVYVEASRMSLLKTFIALLLLLLATALLQACGKNIDVAEWTEEVMLNDGRVIVVWRKATAKSWGFPEPRGADLSFELKYEPMGVHWVSTPANRLLSFDIVDGVPWMATFIDEMNVCPQRKTTDFAASFFKWDGGKWIEVSAAAYPIHIARRNLWSRYWGRERERDSKGLIDWRTKDQLDNLSTPPITVYHYLTTNNRYCRKAY
jgi:hypothetical protein